MEKVQGSKGSSSTTSLPEAGVSQGSSATEVFRLDGVSITADPSTVALEVSVDISDSETSDGSSMTVIS
jgi:hypothetical protein